MLALRSRALRTAKSSLHAAMRWPLAAKLATLIAQERDVVRSARAHAQHHDALVAAVGHVVRRGPFTGMVYASADSTGSTLAPKLLGSYECELHSILDEVVCEGADRYTLVLDIGAAEGLYAVGLARLLPHARVIAWEIDSRGRTLLEANARANGVDDRIDIRGACTAAELEGVASDLAPGASVLVVCDAEGAEYGLFSSAVGGTAALLRQADLLFELHRDAGQTGGIAPREYWKRRLSSTHALRWIDVAGRDPAQYPELAAIPFDQRQPILFERTEDSGWLWARPLRV